jgi:hypothetical protein
LRLQVTQQQNHGLQISAEHAPRAIALLACLDPIRRRLSPVNETEKILEMVAAASN